jgi:sulfite reductase (NADPH) flavoprotein alpha-component
MEVLGNMKVLQPRYYSISSSPLIDKTRVSVTAAVVRYETLGKRRTGVTTTFLCDRFNVHQKCPVFVNKNPDFRLPEDGTKDIIMIGPGTGIAPFRAFVQERVASKASGINLLYFGCRHRSSDFLYHKELEELDASSQIKLRTAFSRDQEKKVYVQHLIAEDQDMIWNLLESGAHVYVCGDAKYMAGDVHDTLLSIIQDKSGCGKDEAHNYLNELTEKKRYQRDVWI